MVADILEGMFKAGAKTFHRHTIERQHEVHDESDAAHNRLLGSALNLSQRRQSKMRAGRETTQPQERFFGVTRHVHDKAPRLTHLNLDGRARAMADQPTHWFLKLLREGSYSRDALKCLVAAIAAEGRLRTHEVPLSPLPPPLPPVTLIASP